MVRTPMVTLDVSVGRLKRKIHAPRSASMQAALCLIFAGILFVSPLSEAQYFEGVIPEGGFTDGAIEVVVEKSLAEKLQESVEQAVVTRVEDSVSDRVLSLGGYPAGYIESRVEETVAERVLSLGGYPAGYIESRVEESVEQSVEESVADNVEVIVDESVADVIEGAVEETIVETVVENIEEDIVDNVEDTVEESVAESLEQGLEQDLDFDIALNADSSLENGMESEIDQLLQNIESEIEVDENRINKNQWLVMAEKEVFEQLAKEGYLFDKVTDLPGIGLLLAEVAAPSSFDINEARQGVIDVVGTGRAKVDLNHIYTAGTTVPTTGASVAPRAAISIPAGIDDLSLKIGMIDSSVDTAHASLANSKIEVQSFVSDDADLPDFHGTAIASIIAANATDYIGLAPKAEIFAASVFEKDQQRGEFASTVSLVRALDWLVTSGVNVVNISLAGPPNRLLQAALEHAARKDVLIVAAAGNGGPMAKPMYPAAYDSVIAVTAVDIDGQVFRLANRGSYLDLAAPGVNLQHALAGGGYTSSSGTSFAVPFAAIAAARVRLLQPTQDARQVLSQTAEDIGLPGRDDIYGYGLLRLAPLSPALQVSLTTNGK
jgi:DNA-binding ferritin-like protein